MTNTTQTHPLSAIVSRDGGEDVDQLVEAFCRDLLAKGWRVDGVRHRQLPRPAGGHDMYLVDVKTAQAFPISQQLGALSQACCVDPSRIAQASGILRRALADRVDLAVTNRFGELEATGEGFAAEMAALIEAGIPLLTVVAEKHLAAWRSFSGEFGIELPPRRSALDTWFAGLAPCTASGASR